jgi:hypothetical protein
MENSRLAVAANTALMPHDLEGKMKMADIIAKSGLGPKDLNTKEKVFIALQYGHELGLTPMASINNITPINGRPFLSADIMYALIANHPEYGGIEWKSRDGKKAEVVILRNRRSGITESFIGYFDFAMATAAGLATKDNYVKYPDRMLRARALSRACKEAFPDVFAGLGAIEDSDEYVPMRDVTPHKGTSASDLANTLLAQEVEVVPAGAEPEVVQE